MLYSMTGFGRAEADVNGRQVVVEIKSLNGKQFDVMTKLPPILRSYELDIRSLLNTALMRGTMDLTVSVKQEGASRPMTVNTSLARFYYQSMKQIADELNLTAEDNILSTLMRMPEIVSADQDVLPEAEWFEVKKVIEAAAEQLMQHRKNEGAVLKKDLAQRIANIEALLEKILPLEAQRTERVRARIMGSLKDISVEKVDNNRLEQELIYYIERSDFSEEKTRLKLHCTYFSEILSKPEISKGKVLNFVLQEVGREINTLGAKANDADIQQIVVQMKDELEKAKEQVLNIL
ncbi:YicC/YloC family endoribonuclease [Taibaiella soli]|uniref:YicC family protein n=1 Tax=Taibaiella soli TaxID=1649169 RepID=A0A2W2B7C2_9BACT|nr:YicC/YloC family endoribonuclease [Taibaiella soli]PZF72149.1 YicC family protein [Taibaiella soli]